MILEGISVVIPLFNKRDTIRRAVGSALSQDPPPEEVIVVDDGSTDGGQELVSSFGDVRVRLVRQANAGPSAARNRGLAEARNELVAFLDADDEWLPGHISTLRSLVSTHPELGFWSTGFTSSESAVPSGGAQEGVPQVYSVGSYLEAQLSGTHIVHSSAVLARKSLIARVGGFQVGRHHGEDQALWLVLVLETPVARSPRITAIYHLLPDSLSNRLVREEDACMTTIKKILEERSDLSEAVKASLMEVRNRFALGHVMGALQNRDPMVADKFLEIAGETRRFVGKRRMLLTLRILDSIFPGIAYRAIATRKVLRGIRDSFGIRKSRIRRRGA